ncbi:hypothetical protein CYCD_24410 [Tenuifilaceae bacterium CYCD]|nr:hypothetical protein CYCD_24410 [Tenuifilaceae bacterium CYCD]
MSNSIINCPQCGLRTKKLENEFYCERCGYFRKKEWKAYRRTDGIEWGWGIFGFACLYFILAVMFYNLFLRDVPISYILLIIAVAAVVTTALLNFFLIRPYQNRPFLDSIKKIQNNWLLNKNSIIEKTFKTENNQEQRLLILQNFKGNYPKLKEISTTDKQESIRLAALKMIIDFKSELDSAHLQDWTDNRIAILNTFLSAENSAKTQLYAVKQFDENAPQLKDIVKGNYPDQIKIAAIESLSNRDDIIDLLYSTKLQEIIDALCKKVKISKKEELSIIKGKYPLALKDYIIATYSSKEKVQELLQNNDDKETIALLNKKLDSLIDADIILEYNKARKSGISNETILEYLNGKYSNNVKEFVINTIDDIEFLFKIRNESFPKETLQMVNSRFETVKLTKRYWIEEKYRNTIAEMKKLTTTSKDQVDSKHIKSDIDQLWFMYELRMDDHIDAYRSNSTSIVKIISTRSTIEDDGYHIKSQWMRIDKVGFNEYTYSTWDTDRLD